jgi:PPOX class probable FMN-dependent enzyme
MVSFALSTPRRGKKMILDAEGSIVSVAALEALYGKPGWVALAGQADRLIGPYRELIAASPYVTLATVGSEGVDCSPRGGTPGFVKVMDDATILIPNGDGNNRNETLRNIAEDARVALHFLIPGCGESLRIKGRASISAAKTLTDHFKIGENRPRTVIIVNIDRVYFHCAKSINRAKLWDSSTHVDRKTLPSVNTMLAAVQWQRCFGGLAVP